MPEMSDDEPQVRIELSIRRVCCPVHSEPFREEWPTGWASFALTLLRAGLETEALIEEAEHSSEGVGAVLDRLPLCERIPAEALERAYIDCGLGRESKCENCGHTRQGVAMRLLEPGNEVPSHVDHVCFECIANRLRPSA